MLNIEKIKEYINSEEGKRSAKEFFDNLELKDKINNLQLERVHKSGIFLSLIQKSIKKYNSHAYITRWYSRGIMPPKSLFWFLFGYAEKYGRECSNQEYEKYGNMFTSSLFFIEGYYLGRMDGQGSVIKIIKSEE